MNNLTNAEFAEKILLDVRRQAHYDTLRENCMIAAERLKPRTPVIMNGEREHANTPPQERPDWPLPSFDALDWARAFCQRNPQIDEDLMVTWFSNALMRGYDEGAARKIP